MMPKSHVRLSAGREAMNEQMQSMCFLAGANSIFYGCKLLTTGNPEANKDIALFNKLTVLNRKQMSQYKFAVALLTMKTVIYFITLNKSRNNDVFFYRRAT